LTYKAGSFALHLLMSTRPPLNIGLIGYAFMGKAHSNAWRQAAHFFELPAKIRLKTICGRNRRAVREAADRFGWEGSETDWRRMIDDPEIDLVDICTPNESHCEIALAAAARGKAILCEKPLARDLPEARRMAAAVKKARVPNMVCHNYRRVPAIALARQMIEQGEIGERLFHFRARYAQDWIVDPKFPLVWRLQSDQAGSGALGDLGSHVIDLARYLVGEFREVCAAAQTFIKERRGGRVTVDDATTMIGRFRNGALASLEATRFAPGRKNALSFEINGSAGSLAFDLEDLNRLRFFSNRDPSGRQGFRDILVTEPGHPYMDKWWPAGHIIGWEHSFTHTIADFVEAVVRRKRIQPDFADALKTQSVLDAIARSARKRNWVQLA
jgi:predicted dehydrogenase